MCVLLGICSILISFGAYFPYLRDILKGKVRPARSARIMFTFLMVIALLQQHSIANGWAVAVTLGEALGSIAILWLAVTHGMGGLKRLDAVCYLLLIGDVVVWLITKNALLALHLTVLADIISFVPTLVKTWEQPDTETPLFFIAGVIAPLLSIVAAGNYSYAIVLFPFYLALANSLEVGLIWYGQGTAIMPGKHERESR